MTGSTLIVGGDLTITGPGCAIRVTGDGGDPRVTVSGRLPRVGGPAAEALRALRAAGVAIEVTDPSGRVLARVGAVRPSILGRLLAGSAAVRPSGHGILSGIRGRTPWPAK